MRKTVRAGRKYYNFLHGSKEFIDKTKVIIDFDSCGEIPQLITLPRRFFKSMNLATIKMFYEIEVDEYGKKKDKKENSVYFEGLEVSKNQTIWDKQGEYPVISTSFAVGASVNGGRSFCPEQNLEQFKTIMARIYTSFAYLQKSTMLDPVDKETCHRYRARNVDKSMVIDGIPFLCQMLNKHFKKKPIVLIDEYDYVVNEALGVATTENFEDTYNFVNSILISTFKTNEELGGGIMTGTLPILKRTAHLGLNNVKEVNFKQDSFAGCYGFSEDEVKTLLARCDWPPEAQTELKIWYNGYKIGKHEIYNPWSVLRFLEEKEICQYWNTSGFINKISDKMRLDDYSNMLIRLINGESVEFVKEKLNYDLLEKFNKLKSPGGIFEKNIFLTYLLLTGYLSEDSPGTLKIPNLEIKEFFSHSLNEYKTEFLNRWKRQVDSKLLDTFSDELGEIFNVNQEVHIVMKSVCKTLEDLLASYIQLDPSSALQEQGKKTVKFNEDLFKGIFTSAGLKNAAVTHYGCGGRRKSEH